MNISETDELRQSIWLVSGLGECTIYQLSWSCRTVSASGMMFISHKVVAPCKSCIYSELRQVSFKFHFKTPFHSHRYTWLKRWQPRRWTAESSMESQSVLAEIARIWLVSVGISMCVSVKGSGNGSSWNKRRSESEGAIVMWRIR